MMNKRELEKLRKEAREYRKKYFKAQIRKPSMVADIYPDAVDLEITPNGRQWTSITLMPDEVPKVIEALQKALPFDGRIEYGNGKVFIRIK